MYDGIYLLKNFRLQENTLLNFPVSYREVPQGEQGIQHMHEHDTIELVLVTAGTGVHICNAQRAAIRAGDVLLIYPAVRHGYDDCETLGLINIMYDPFKLPFPILDGGRIHLFRRFFPQAIDLQKLPRSPEAVLHFDSPESMEQVVSEAKMLHRELSSKLPGSMMVSTVKLLDIILMILRFAEHNAEEPTEEIVFPLEKILEYINKNFTHEISLDQLVKMSIYSKRVFQYKFKELTGYGITEFILRKRIARAQDLLRTEPNRPVGDIGFECGFIDSNYFSRKFRDIAGITPREYRKAGN
ncbi:MAG: helix-turn-helix domain-containing protein [Victivallales bacterium]|nr:helix-turn-helix domain-containing protein [Victivallales bacterium]